MLTKAFIATCVVSAFAPAAFGQQVQPILQFELDGSEGEPAMDATASIIRQLMQPTRFSFSKEELSRSSVCANTCWDGSFSGRSESNLSKLVLDFGDTKFTLRPSTKNLLTVKKKI